MQIGCRLSLMTFWFLPIEFASAAFLTWLINWLSLIPYRRASAMHWTERARRLYPARKLFRHYSATPNTLILVLRDAVEVPVGAEENLTVGNGWRRVARLAQVIHGQKFELLRIGPKNGGDASSARDIQPPGCHHDRTPAFSAVEPLGPPDFSGLAFHTFSSPRSGVDYEDESINDHTRANPLGLSLHPELVGSGHVAGSAQLETNRASSIRSRERDADVAGHYGRRIDQSSQWVRQSLEEP